MKRIIAILLVATIVVSCNKGGSGDKKAELEKLRKEQSELAAKIKTLEQEIQKEGGNGEGKARFVTLDTLKKAPFTHYLEIQGRVEAEENVNLTARSMGIVTKVNVNPGDVVTKGQVLAVIDDAIITKSVDELKSRLDFANIVYMKQKNLWDQKIGTEVQFLQAKNNKEALEKNLATLNEHQRNGGRSEYPRGRSAESSESSDPRGKLAEAESESRSSRIIPVAYQYW
jgi:membrane fusion protein (multidrug efflux system)